ncbi:MAG: DUF1631 family protein, partial [Moraxellaceae bacterium]
LGGRVSREKSIEQRSSVGEPTSTETSSVNPQASPVNSETSPVNIDAPSRAAVIAADFAANRALKQSVSVKTPKVSKTDQQLQIFTRPKLVTVIDALQSLSLPSIRSVFQVSHNHVLPAQDISKLKDQLIQHVAITAGGAVDAGDMHTIELVGMLFDCLRTDVYLPAPSKALLSYLYAPFLKIALIDKNFIERPDHSARVLFNSLVDAGTRWVNSDGTDQHDMFVTIKSTVFRVLEHFKNDVTLFNELLTEFNAYTTNISRRHEIMERRSIEKAKGEEKLREAKLHVNRAVRSCTNGREMPSAILLLLLQPWSDYLSFVLLRYGQHSKPWISAVRVIDDLLWTLEPKTLQIDKELHLVKQALVINSLEHGFATIGYEQTKGRKLIEAVSAMQKMALQSRVAEPAPTVMRSKLEMIAAEKAGDLGELAEPQNEDELNTLESVKHIAFGTWLEFTGGKRFKLVLFNQKTRHCMLLDQQGKKVSLIAGLSLARKMIAGDVRIISTSSKPFFERALANIHNSLNKVAPQSLVANPTDSSQSVAS